MVNDEIKFVIYNNSVILEPGKISISENSIPVYENTITEVGHDYGNFVFTCSDGDVVRIPKFAFNKCSIKIDNGEQE